MSSFLSSAGFSEVGAMFSLPARNPEAMEEAIEEDINASWLVPGFADLAAVWGLFYVLATMRSIWRSAFSFSRTSTAMCLSFCSLALVISSSSLCFLPCSPTSLTNRRS